MTDLMTHSARPAGQSFTRFVPQVLIVDIDDTLMPWYNPVDEACRAALGVTTPAKSWRMWEDYGCTQKQWGEIVGSLCVPGGLYHTPPYEGAIEALRLLAWEGHEIHIVTARGFMARAEEIRAWTQEWVEEWAVPHKSLIFSKDKGAVALELGATFAVDDGFHNYEALTFVGVDTYLLNQPHNSTAYDVDPAKRVNSVADWAEIVREASRV